MAVRIKPYVGFWELCRMNTISKFAIAGFLALGTSCQGQEPGKGSPGAATTSPLVTGTDSAVHMSDSISAEDVRQRWLKDRSYYAFQELVDELDPNFRAPPTMKEVEQSLGRPTCAGPECYPNFTARHWLYETDRKIPAGGKAILLFDENDVLKSIDWVSE